MVMAHHGTGTACVSLCIHSLNELSWPKPDLAVHCKLSKSNIFPSVIQLMEPEALASLESFIEDLGRFTDWGRLPKLSTAWRSFGDHKLSSQAAFLAVDGGDARISQRASQYQMRTSQNQMRSAKKNRQHWVHRHLHLWYRHVGHVGHVGQSLGTPHLQLGDMCHSSFFWTCFSLTPLLPGDWKCSIRDFKTHLFFIVLLYLSYCRLYRFGRPKWKLWALHRRAALARCKWR